MNKIIWLSSKWVSDVIAGLTGCPIRHPTSEKLPMICVYN